VNAVLLRDGVSVLALARRNLVNFFLSRFALVGVLMVPMVLLFGLGALYSRAMNASGVRYIDFLVPGIALQAAMFASVASAWTMTADRLSGFHRAILISVSRPGVIVGGRLLTDVCKYTMALAVIVIVGLILGFRVHHGGVVGVVLALVILLAFALVCSLGYVAIGCRVKRFRFVQAMTMTPFPVLFLLSTAISPARDYPHWLQPLVRNTPVSVISEAIRGLLARQQASLAPALAWLLAASFVFGVLAVRGLRTFRGIV
jgi:ABC transporter DrrB family efflux protein